MRIEELQAASIFPISSCSEALGIDTLRNSTDTVYFLHSQKAEEPFNVILQPGWSTWLSQLTKVAPPCRGA